MISCYFGVPGSGKTTLLTKFAYRAMKDSKLPKLVARLKKRKQYKHVYTNFYCEGAEIIDFKDLGNYKTYDSLIILDELAMDADNRKFKSFPDEIRDFFILHRHLGNDIIYATQSYEAVDLKIRFLTQELWYMSKSVLPLLRGFTYAKRIYRAININEHTSELILGYRFCNLLESFFVRNVQICWRRKYYKKFDSFEEGKLEPRAEYHSPSTWYEAPRLEVSELPESGKIDNFTRIRARFSTVTASIFSKLNKFRKN